MKVVLITGASSGIGESIGVFLAKKGFKVYGTSRSPKTATDEIHFVQMDVTNQESVDKAVQEVINDAGKIDVLINNAGLGALGSVEEIDLKEVEAVFDTNVYGILRTSRAVLPHMRKQNSGLIINTSSIGGQVGLPFRGTYSASKFAVEGFSEALSMEVKPFGIKVVIAQPGDFKTNISQSRRVTEPVEGSVYASGFNTTVQFVNEEMEHANEPIMMAKEVYKIIQSNAPKLRYRIGKPMQKITPKIKGILPSRFFEKLIMNHYKLK